MKINFETPLGGKYYVRSFELSDKETLVNYANNYNISKWLRDRFPNPYTEAHAEEWLMHACNQKPELNFALADDLELIGGIGLHPQEDVNRFSAEIGYWLAEPYWNQGIISKAVKTLTDLAFSSDNKIGIKLNRIFACVFEGNVASEKVLEKAGYKREAVLRKAVFKEGKFLDQYIYSVLKDELPKDPLEKYRSILK